MGSAFNHHSLNRNHWPEDREWKINDESRLTGNSPTKATCLPRRRVVACAQTDGQIMPIHQVGFILHGPYPHCRNSTSKDIFWNTVKTQSVDPLVISTMLLYLMTKMASLHLPHLDTIQSFWCSNLLVVSVGLCCLISQSLNSSLHDGVLSFRRPKLIQRVQRVWWPCEDFRCRGI